MLQHLAWAAVAAFGLAAVAQAAPAPVDVNTIPDSEYVRATADGHLAVNGQRTRFWAVIGKTYANSGVKNSDTPEQKAAKVANARKGTDVLVQRFIDLGFNANRLWTGFPGGGDYEIGDGSAMDDVDYYIARMKERGLKIWVAGLNSAGDAQPQDVSIIDDPGTAEAWKKAVAEGGGKMSIRNNPARIWDPRLEALGIKRMQNVATHFNKHTGLRWCDDPVFAVWELSNEEWWMSRMRGGSWQKLPAYFRDQLIAKWNDYLKAKYGSDEKLKAAWKDLLPGESLAKGSILLVPMAGASKSEVSINDANPAAKEALTALKQEYKREDFDPQRGADVLEFFLDLHLKHKQREAAALRPLGKSTRLCPWVYDTGTGYDIHAQYLHQQADAVAHDAYVNGIYQPMTQAQLDAKVAQAPTELAKMQTVLEWERKQPNSGPWVNWLLKPPGVSQGVPWLEHNKIEGKPYFCYETQIMQAAKYRADFPLRLAALASIQDWDFVCWHYFSPGEDVATNPRTFDKAMDITTGSHPQGYHFTYDEVQNAMMRAAGLMWRNQLVAPAANPTKFIFGRKSLYTPDAMPYGGSYGKVGMNMIYTTYQHGVRISIDPTREDDQVIGPMVEYKDRNTHNPYTPNDQIMFDWKKGFLSFDAPGAVSFTGLMANVGEQVKFKNGVTLSAVSIKNPPDIYEPMKDDEKYIAFALHSTDGKPLAQASGASLSIVSTSFNTGYKMGQNGGGKTPVLVARVGATIECAALDGMSYSFKDWHMNEIGQGKITGGKLVIPNDQPVFVVELKR